jgi:hypothetical protein
LILYDRILIRSRQVEPIYRLFLEGRLRFMAEPWAGKFEEFADALTAQRRGWCDCDDAVPWRCAEWQEYRGVNAQPKIYWRMRDAEGRAIHDESRWKEAATIAYHTEVRLPCLCHRSLKCQDAPVEDVSTFLGMARRRATQEAA